MENIDGLTVIGKVVAVLTDYTGKERIVDGEIVADKRFILGRNIVTNSGDAYYAQMACGETPAADFAAGGLRLGDDDTAPQKTDDDVTSFLAGTGKAIEANYPKTNDDDGDNTGAAIDTASWKYSYTTAQGNASGIKEGAIVDNVTTPHSALCHFLFASSFDKTSSDTLKVFVNHLMEGV